MNPIVKDHIVSAANTFLVTFIVTLGATLSASGSIQWTTTFWLAVAGMAGRAAIKEALARILPVSLGGRK